MNHGELGTGNSTSVRIHAAFTVVAAAILLAIVIFDFQLAAAQSFPSFVLDPGGFPVGRDFMNTWMGGRSAFSGGPADWFDSGAYMAAITKVTGIPDLAPLYWSYPPHLLFFIWPLGLLGFLPSYISWCVAGLALYVWTATSCGVERKYWVFLAVAPAVTVNVFLGQNGFLTAALLIGGLANLERRPILAGILFGILTIKPQLGLLLPIVLVLGGHWRVIGSAVVTTVFLVAATAAWFGPEIWTAYWHKVLPQQNELLDVAGIMGWPIVASALINARLAGLPADLAWVVQGAASVCAVGAVVWTFWRKRDPVLSLALFVTATFLFSPWIMNYDMVVFGWIVALLRQRGNEAFADQILSLALWMLPILMFPFGFAQIPIALLILPLFAARLLWRLSNDKSKQASSVTLPALA
ncbi:glycosyltransferase family 87 protein [Bradyrhizobium yuanmingense]|uniref:glycosyltransferase family 87 protein n=1 Tax=Bradyrhizobium yuanmingense TaxID=108015 RepID=UPI0023B8C97E|nr:glycosyltransferase family 87 protein [Bradyrhizobium yuanmingense]MDF0582328.1 glycosyltransferase family 87 protein [Bradyrhizobium yuanmingense]